MWMGDDRILPPLHPLVQPRVLEKQADAWRNNPATKALAQSRRAASRAFSQHDLRASEHSHTWVPAVII